MVQPHISGTVLNSKINGTVKTLERIFISTKNQLMLVTSKCPFSSSIFHLLFRKKIFKLRMVLRLTILRNVAIELKQKKALKILIIQFVHYILLRSMIWDEAAIGSGESNSILGSFYWLNQVKFIGWTDDPTSFRPGMT